MIELNHIEKYFFKDDPREIHALQDINLTIADNEFSLLSGPSGCGKTTLLNLIGALDTVDSGSILFDGIDITKLNELDTDFFPDRTSGDFPAYGNCFGVWIAVGDGSESSLSACFVCGVEWEEVSVGSILSNKNIQLA